MRIDIKSLTSDIILKSQQFRKKYGLLVNDSTVIAITYAHNLKYLVSNDAGILNIDNINIYRPTDINL